jgi:hypothetical protein
MKKLFISYAHADRALTQPLLDLLNANLGACERNDYDVWIDTKIACGSAWDDSIRAELAAADLGLLLVSPSFRVSRYIQTVEQSALLNKAVAVGLKLMDYGTQLGPELSQIQIYRHLLPRSGETVFSQLTNRQQREAFAQGLYAQIRDRLS